MNKPYQEPVHPESGAELSQLERYLLRLRMIAHEAQTILRGMHISAKGGDITNVLDNNLLFSLMNEAKLIVSKFLEVWEQFGSLGPSDARVREIRRIAQPAADRIKIWPGLRRFRSNILAHPYLTTSGKFIGPWDLLDKGDVPTYHAEGILLLQCVHAATMTVLLEFEAEYLGVLPLLTGHMDPPDAAPGISKGPEISGELKRIYAGIDANLRPRGLNLRGPVANEFSLANKVNPEDRPFV